MKQISLDEAKSLVLKNKNNPDFIVLDIRTPAELAGGVIGHPINIDFYSPDFMQKISALDRQKTYLIYCRSGNRSKRAVALMEQMGFSDILELKNGILG